MNTVSVQYDQYWQPFKGWPYYSVKSHAELCPVCIGRGEITADPSGMLMLADHAVIKKVCHGCNGLGWVTVRE